MIPNGGFRSFPNMSKPRASGDDPENAPGGILEVL